MFVLTGSQCKQWIKAEEVSKVTRKPDPTCKRFILTYNLFECLAFCINESLRKNDINLPITR